MALIGIRKDRAISGPLLHSRERDQPSALPLRARASRQAKRTQDDSWRAVFGSPSRPQDRHGFICDVRPQEEKSWGNVPLCAQAGVFQTRDATATSFVLSSP